MRRESLAPSSQDCALIASAVSSALSERGLGVKRRLALAADVPEAVQGDVELLCRQVRITGTQNNWNQNAKTQGRLFVLSS